MLDFYKISDADPDPEDPVEENLIGSFTLDEFRQFAELTSYAQQHSLHFHFFEDFRLRHKSLIAFQKQMQDYILPTISSSGIEKSSAYKKLSKMFQDCMDDGAGVIAFCD